MVALATLTVAEEMTCGTSYTATISKPSHTPAYTVILKQTIRDETTRLLASSSATSYSFNFSTSLFDPATYGIEAARISSLPVTLTLETWVMYNNSVDFIGANTYDVTVKVPMSSPSISISGYSLDYVTDGIAADFLAAEQASGLHFTNGLTKIKTTTISATPQNYAYISKIYVTGLIDATVFTNTANPPQQYRGRIDISGWSRALDTVKTSGYVYFNAIDSRGNMATFMQGLTLSTIKAPTLSNITWTRGTVSGSTFTPSDSGTVMRMTATLSSQTGSASIKFSRNGTAVETNSYNNGSITYLFSSCPPTANTELLVEVDNVLATSSYSCLATITAPDINYNPELPGIAFGKQASTAKSVELAEDWTLRAKNHEVDLVVDWGYDSTSGFHWRKWSSGHGELWASNLSLTPTSSNADNGQYYSENLYVYPPFLLDNWTLTGSSNNYTYICNGGWSTSNGRYSFRLGRASPIATGTAHTIRLYITGTVYVPS